MSPSSLMWCVGMTSTRLDGSWESMLSHVTRSSGVSECMQYCSIRRCMLVLGAGFSHRLVIYRILGVNVLDMSLGKTVGSGPGADSVPARQPERAAGRPEPARATVPGRRAQPRDQASRWTVPERVPARQPERAAGRPEPAGATVPDPPRPPGDPVPPPTAGSVPAGQPASAARQQEPAEATVPDQTPQSPSRQPAGQDKRGRSYTRNNRPRIIPVRQAVQAHQGHACVDVMLDDITSLFRNVTRVILQLREVRNAQLSWTFQRRVMTSLYVSMRNMMNHDPDVYDPPIFSELHGSDIELLREVRELQLSIDEHKRVWNEMRTSSRGDRSADFSDRGFLVCKHLRDLQFQYRDLLLKIGENYESMTRSSRRNMVEPSSSGMPEQREKSAERVPEDGYEQAGEVPGSVFEPESGRESTAERQSAAYRAEEPAREQERSSSRRSADFREQETVPDSQAEITTSDSDSDQSGSRKDPARFEEDVRLKASELRREILENEISVCEVYMDRAFHEMQLCVNGWIRLQVEPVMFADYDKHLMNEFPNMKDRIYAFNTACREVLNCRLEFAQEFAEARTPFFIFVRITCTKLHDMLADVARKYDSVKDDLTRDACGQIEELLAHERREHEYFASMKKQRFSAPPADGGSDSDYSGEWMVQRLGMLQETPCLYKAWTRACAAECGGTCTP